MLSLQEMEDLAAKMPENTKTVVLRLSAGDVLEFDGRCGPLLDVCPPFAFSMPLVPQVVALYFVQQARSQRLLHAGQGHGGDSLA